MAARVGARMSLRPVFEAVTTGRSSRRSIAAFSCFSSKSFANPFDQRRSCFRSTSTASGTEASAGAAKAAWTVSIHVRLGTERCRGVAPTLALEAEEDRTHGVALDGLSCFGARHAAEVETGDVDAARHKVLAGRLLRLTARLLGVRPCLDADHDRGAERDRGHRPRPQARQPLRAGAHGPASSDSATRTSSARPSSPETVTTSSSPRAQRWGTFRGTRRSFASTPDNVPLPRMTRSGRSR